MKAVIIYSSRTGNTEKVAKSIREGLESTGSDVSFRTVDEASGVDFFDYDLVCIGFPSYQWHPPKPVVTFLTRRFSEYRKLGRVRVGAPKLAGKYALIFCTYSGPHTGINEALPAGKYAGQFFEHLGFTVLDEWYVLGEFHGSDEASTMGRMGDIRGLPNEEDLRNIRQDAMALPKRIYTCPAVEDQELPSDE